MKKKSAEGKKPAGERIFEVAADLFYRRGIRDVGVEEIVRRAGVAKISLYRSFPSKDALVVAYLENLNVVFWRQWDESFVKFQDDPRKQLHSIMTYLAKRTSEQGYRGCPFINYCAEFPDESHPGHRVVTEIMSEMRRRFVLITEAMGAKQPKRLADALLLLVEGAYAVSQTLGGPKGPGYAIVWGARALVDAELGPG